MKPTPADLALAADLSATHRHLSRLAAKRLYHNTLTGRDSGDPVLTAMMMALENLAEAVDRILISDKLIKVAPPNPT